MLNKISTIFSRQQMQSTYSFALQRRKATGGSERLSYWGFDNETDPLGPEIIDVAEVDMSGISKTGGGIHCMAQALRRDASA